MEPLSDESQKALVGAVVDANLAGILQQQKLLKDIKERREANRVKTLNDDLYPEPIPSPAPEPELLPAPDSFILNLKRLKNGWLLHGTGGDYVVRTGQELLDALKDDIGLELIQPPSGVNGAVMEGPPAPPPPPPGEHPTRLKAKDRGVSTNTSEKRKLEFKHPTCGHVSDMTAGGCGACNKRFCSQCFRCGCP